MLTSFSKSLNETYDVNVPLVLMNSLNTDDETKKALNKYKGKNIFHPKFTHFRALNSKLIKLIMSTYF